MVPHADLLTWEGLQRLAATHVLRRLGTRGVMFCQPGDGTKVWKLPNGRGLRPMGPPQATAPTRHQIVSTRDAWWAPWRETLRALPGPFVLVSTFHDSVIGDTAVAEMCAPGSSVAAWFGVQVGSTDPRITAMPLGVKGEMLGHLAAVDPRPDSERDLPLYVNYSVRTQERRDLFTAFPWAVCEEPKPDTTPRYLAQMARARFVLSPPGRSWDCYRTYEAIAMGAIPIVKRCEPFSRVVDDLPVLLVDDWREITPERLDRVWREKTTGTVERMTLPYWAARIREAQHGTYAA